MKKKTDLKYPSCFSNGNEHDCMWRFKLFL